MSAQGPINPVLTTGEAYPFVTLEARLRELLPAGVTPIRFSAGDPREETPEFIREALRAAVPAVSSYPTVAGEPGLREACAAWAQRRFGVTLDPERQVLPVNGTKEAVFSLALAVVGRESEKRIVVIPSPAYPVYAAGARFAGAEPHFTPLASATGWRFDPDRVPDAVWKQTALLWLNVPHNPTGALLDPAGYRKVLECARAFGFWVAADEAYSEVYFDQRPHSALEFGTENVLALHTLSKRSAMTGFRSGFMLRQLDWIHELNVEYDASTFPTFIGPLARAYYFSRSRLGPEELKTRGALFGRFRDGLRPNKPFRWTTPSGGLTEIPVTTMPGSRAPIHVSYLLYLAGVSPALARAYFDVAVALCRATGTAPSLLLHPLDFMDLKDAPALGFFPAMSIPAERKMDLVSSALDAMGRHWDIGTMERHARTFPPSGPARPSGEA